MGQIKKALWWGAGGAAILASAVYLIGCSSTPNGGGGNGATYNLVVVLEKNLDSGQDLIWLRFRKDDAGIPGGVVVVDGDTIETSSASGQGSKTYAVPRWDHGEKILITAIDAGESFLYRDSVVIPSDFLIENVIPPNHLWRPLDANAQVSWTTSVGSVNYAVSVKARSTSSPSRGLAEYSESQSALTHVIPPTTFQDQANNVIEDVYDIYVIAYNPNFIERQTSHAYKVPPSDDVPAPIQESDIDGGIAALVVADRDTIIVQTE